MKKQEIKLLDDLWAKAVKLSQKCEVCRKRGSVVRLNACHIIGRRHRATRWGAWFKDKKGKSFYDLCGFCGCYMDHKEYDEHGPKEKYIREKIIGLERYERIRNKATQSITKYQDFFQIKSNLLDYIKKHERR